LRFLEDDVGATVLDWQRDFAPGRSILDEIEEARVRCTTAVFLFTKDDSLSDATSGNAASPRDNVVFEAGYFVSGKGKKRVLIIRDNGTKMPADLGGDIYASLDDRDDLSAVEQTLRRFLARL
jgi:predicted nucleotide-binding protein